MSNNCVRDPGMPICRPLFPPAMWLELARLSFGFFRSDREVLNNRIRVRALFLLSTAASLVNGRPSARLRRLRGCPAFLVTFLDFVRLALLLTGVTCLASLWHGLEGLMV